MAGEDEDYGSARITITLDDSGVVADAQALANRISRALDRGTRRIGAQIHRTIQRSLDAAGAVTVQVDADLDRFNAALRGLNSLGSVDLRVVPDLTGFVARVQAALAGAEVSIRVVPDLSDLDARIRAHRPPDVTVRVNANADTDRLTRSLSALGGIAGRVAGALGRLLVIGVVGTAAAGAAAAVAALGAALGPAAGLIAAYPAAIAGFEVALGTLKLALLGVEDALEAAFGDDAAAFQEALDKLAPAAQKAVQSVRALAPELRQVQQAVQQAFFQQFAGDITAAIKNLLPLRKQLAGLATEFGNAASEGLRFAASQQAMAPLQTIIKGTTAAASGLSAVVAPLAKGFLDVAAAITQAFGPQVGSAIAQRGAQLGTWLSSVAASGQAVQWVRDALATLRQLGAIASNVGGIISGVFRAADTAGGGLLNNLQQVTGAFREFVNSAQGQEAFGNLFGAIAAIARQLGPILSALVTQLGRIAPALAPVFTALGPALVGLINAVGPAIAALGPSLEAVAQALGTAFETIGPALAPLGAAIGSVISALAPLLPLVGQLVAAVATALAPVLQTLAAAFAPIIEAVVGALMPVLPPLAAAFAAVATAVLPLAQALGQALGSALTALGPLLATLSTAVAQLVTALAPLIAQIAQALAPVLPPLAAAFTAVVQALMPLIPPIVSLVTSLAPLVSIVVSLAAPLLQIAAAFASWAVINVVVPIIQGIVTALNGLATALSFIIGIVTTFVTTVIGWFRSLYNTLVGHSIIPDLVNGITSWFGRLPGMILSAISSLVGSVIGVFSRLFSSVVSVVTTGISRIASWFSRLPGQIVSALSGIGSRIAGVFTGAIGAAVGAVNSLIGSIVRAFSGLPGKITSAIGDIGGTVLGKIKGGLGKVGGLLGFADGGIINSPTVGLIGEAGPEVIIPLTRPQRARQLAEQSGLLDILGAADGSSRGPASGPRREITNTFHIYEAGDAHTTAHRVTTRLALAAGVI
ncbi:hypothetical protein ACFY8S_01405 [Streptomyces hygroscopicus]|uniref:phage tail protein n=1 Tax=Streptomyces hygroscopicus TaxID=1912 RepID=UPI0036BEE549